MSSGYRERIDEFFWLEEQFLKELEELEKHDTPESERFVEEARRGAEEAGRCARCMMMEFMVKPL